MDKTTSEKIIEYIAKNSQASGKELADYLEITDRGVRKQLKTLLERNEICKIGKSPKVFYRIAAEKTVVFKLAMDGVVVGEKVKKFINDHYLNITPIGERKEGWAGFVAWCQKTNQDVARMAQDYYNLMEKYNKFKTEKGLIDGRKKIKNTFPEMHLDELFYVDFYSIERFGKTKLGQLLLHAKQSQNKKLIREISSEVKEKVEYLVKKFRIDGVGYIPPTVKREVQFMKELQRNLKLPLRMLAISKIKTEIAVAQKTLTKLPDRIENAKKTFIVEGVTNYNNILLIDDAVGSGATLNEVAGKIREKKICKGKIIGLAITGSFKGFDVISEV
ncbi:MAG: HTH domain-containing protein [Parcubacteria group bacterium]|jgi:biotin operon repressor/hypoxanthine-guanine phosphoribosyltransferase